MLAREIRTSSAEWKTGLLLAVTTVAGNHTWQRPAHSRPRNAWQLEPQLCAVRLSVKGERPMVNSTFEPPPVDTHPTPRLHRSATDSVLAGVCGGMAETLGIDSSLIRLAFVIATLWGGVGVLAYIVLAIVLPIDQQAAAPVWISSAANPHRRRNGSVSCGRAAVGWEHGLGARAELGPVLARCPDRYRRGFAGAQSAHHERRLKGRHQGGTMSIAPYPEVRASSA